MKYGFLGRTGVKVSKICLGCMSYGSPDWRSWVLDEDGARPFFQRAVESGINFFDTADMYSRGASEEVTGRMIREYARREEVVVATKVYFPMTEGPNMGGLSRKHIEQACDASLRRLGVECIDLYQIHRLDPNTPIEETLSAMSDLVRKGKVRYLGASSMAAWQFAQALAVSARRDWPRFDVMQNHYNLVYREEEREMLPLCAQEGVAVIPWSPLARGLLAGKHKSITDAKATARSAVDKLTPRLYDQPSDWDVVQQVRKTAKARGVEPAQIALAWLLSKPTVTAPIIGATKLEHLDAAIGAVELVLDAEEVRALEAPYLSHPVRGHD